MKIAVLGGYGVGITMLVPRSPEAGETVLGGRLSHEHGGKGSNQAVAMARWGASPSLITAIGDDSAGRGARELWATEGVNAHAVRTVDSATMAGIILVDESGENRIAIASGALDALTEADMDASADIIESSQALVISLEVPHDAAQRAAQIAHDAAVPVILNPAPAANVPEALWTRADLLVPNVPEARMLLGDEHSSEPELARSLQERTGATVVVTCGAAGAVIADTRGVREVGGVRVDAVDTTGAGDTFVGVLAVELLETSDLDSAARVACAAAAISVTRAGVVPGLPYRAERAAMTGDAA